MDKKFLKELTDAGIVKVNFEKKNLSQRLMVCTTNTEYLKENAVKTGWKENVEAKASADTILPVWDIEAEGWRNITIAKVLFISADNEPKFARFHQIVRELDDSGFTDLGVKKITTLNETHLKTLFGNLWSMFTTRYTPEERKAFNEKNPTAGEPFGASVSDYGWTVKVEEAFYDHPANKPIVEAAKNSGAVTWEMFSLDAEPSAIDMFDDSVTIEEGFKA